MPSQTGGRAEATQRRGGALAGGCATTPNYSRDWGYFPVGGILTVLIIIVILRLLGVI